MVAPLEAPAVNPQKVIKKYNALETNTRLWRNTWESLASYILPNKTGISRLKSPAETSTQVYDSTAINANQVLAASMHSVLTNQIMRWFSLKTSVDSLNNDDDTKKWLDDVASLVFLMFRQSNLNSEVAEVYQDLGCFGTGCMLFEEEVVGKSAIKFRFTAIPIGTYVVDENAHGRVSSLYRKFSLSPSAIVERWKDKASSVIKEKAKKEDSDEEFEVLAAVFPFEESWVSAYVEYETKTVLENRLYFEFPYLVPRWSKSSGEKYGRGPGHVALPDIQSLNETRKQSLKLLGKIVDPTVFIHADGAVGKMKFWPAVVNKVKGDPNAILRFYTPPTNINYEGMNVENLRQSIKDIFFYSQLQLVQGSIMTATEVETRLELMNRILGPTLGRLETEMLSGLITRAFNIVNRAGLLPPITPAMETYMMETNGGTPLTIEYDSPLARAQKVSETLSLQRFLEFTMKVGSMNPTALDVVELDEVVRQQSVATGVSPKIIRSAEAVTDIRNQRTQAMENQSETK